MGTRRVGVIGYPVEHSLSPDFQQPAFDACGIDARYERWLTADDEVAERVETLRDPAFFGANVTVPHKARVFDLVDDHSELARWAGAVNTIINQGGKLYGDNTDIPGFLAPLSERSISLPDSSVVVLGAGGAARGILVALLSAGCQRITLANRTPARAQELADTLGAGITMAPLDDELATHCQSAALLVNTTAIGWEDGKPPVSDGVLSSLPDDALVYDLTYRTTPFLAAAARLGYDTLDGLAMLVHQGAESFRLWTGQNPPFDVMWQAAVGARAAQDR